MKLVDIVNKFEIPTVEIIEISNDEIICTSDNSNCDELDNNGESDK